MQILISVSLKIRFFKEYSQLLLTQSQIHLKLPISQSKFSGFGKFYFEISVVSDNRN